MKLVWLPWCHAEKLHVASWLNWGDPLNLFLQIDLDLKIQVFDLQLLVDVLTVLLTYNSTEPTLHQFPVSYLAYVMSEFLWDAVICS